MSNEKNTRKRPREQITHVEVSPEEAHIIISSPQKRLNPNRSAFEEILDLPSSQTASIIHHVQCSTQAKGHERHGQSAVYQDAPRLFRGDSRASVLRGRLPLHNSWRGTQSSDNGNLAVVRLYNCELFHNDVGDCFTRTRPPCLDPPIPEDLWPYFDVLYDDTELATPTSESIRMTKQLRRTMEALAEARPNLLPGWEEELRPPYVQIYHARSFIKSWVDEAQSEDQSQHAIELVNYVEDTFGPSHAEAELLFSQGLVKKSHMSMLFRPDDVVVSFEQGKPRGFATCGSLLTSKVPWELHCFSWEFDGSFTKQKRVFKIEWPSKEEGPLNLAGLSMYPLRLDRTGQFEAALRSSGEMFWSCRTRKLVAYDEPSAHSATRAVGSLLLASSMSEADATQSKARYMVDMGMYTTYHSNDDNQEEAPTSTQTLAYEVMCRDEPPCGQFLLLLPPTIFGFGMHDKKWSELPPPSPVKEETKKKRNEWFNEID